MTDPEKQFSTESIDKIAEPAPELSRVISLEQLKGNHFELEIEANEAECQALAKRFDLIELKNFTAHLIFTMTPSKSPIFVKGNFEASVIQACVVTLEPVPSEIKGEYRCEYSQEITLEDVEIIEFSEEAEDPPEAIIDGVFDVGIMLTEEFGLALDPFPRAPGADFDEVRKATNGKLEEPDSNNPFAVLKKLK